MRESFMMASTPIGRRTSAEAIARVGESVLVERTGHERRTPRA